MITTMDDIINIKMTLEELITLEGKIRSKQDTVKDYQKLDSFLSKFLPPDYFIGVMKEFGIYTFEALEAFRKNPPEPRNPTNEGRVSGSLLGLISFLKTCI